MDEAGANPQPLPAPTSITQVHAKLAARIAKLQGARFGTGANAGFEPGSKEELLEEARIRRGELREKRRKRTREEKKLEKKQGGKDEGWKKKTADDFTAKAGKVRCSLLVVMFASRLTGLVASHISDGAPRAPGEALGPSRVLRRLLPVHPPLDLRRGP